MSECKISNPYGNYGHEEYHAWLAMAGLEELKVEMSIEEMILPGSAGLEGFIRTTWLPLPRGSLKNLERG